QRAVSRRARRRGHRARVARHRHAPASRRAVDADAGRLNRPARRTPPPRLRALGSTRATRHSTLPTMAKINRKFWFTFPTRTEVERPVIWEMSRKYPDVVFDIRQASVQNEIGIMAVLLEGEPAQIDAAVKF